MSSLDPGIRTSARRPRAWGPAAVASAAALALAVLTPTTGHAAQAADCPSGALCLYSEDGFRGDRLPLSSLTGSGACISLVDLGWAGRAKSAVNTHPRSAVLFPADDCVGDPYRVNEGAGVANLGAFVPLSAWVPGWTS